MGRNHILMRNPPRQQPLQLLYPGRYMSSEYTPDLKNIAPVSEFGKNLTNEVLDSHLIDDVLTSEAEARTEYYARELAGKVRIPNHPAVSPEALINDPELRSMKPELDPSVQEFDTKVPSSQDLNTAMLRAMDPVVDRLEKVIQNQEKLFPDPGFDRKYFWNRWSLPGVNQKQSREFFDNSKPEKTEKKNQWLIAGIIIVLLFVLIGVAYICFGKK